MSNHNRKVYPEDIHIIEKEYLKKIKKRRDSSFILNIFLLALVLCGLIFSVATAIWAHDVAHAYRDLTIERRIQSYSSPNLTLLMNLISYLGHKSVIVITVLFLLFFLILFRKPVQAAVLFISVAGGVIIDLTFKPIIGRLGPGITTAPSGLLGFTNYSFPSGHVIYYVTCFLPLAWFIWEWRFKGNWLWRAIVSILKVLISTVLLLLVLLIGISRIYLGFHWPSDVLGGYALGVFWSSLVLIAYVRYRYNVF